MSLSPQPPPGACPTLGCVCLWNQKSRERTNLLSSRCSWQSKMPREAAGGGGLGLPLCIAAVKTQASAAAGTGGEQSDVGAGS